jgi:hypothetical protein
VLAAALAVALAGDRAEPGTGGAGQPERQRQVDPRRHRVDAVRVLLGSPAGQHVARAGLREEGDGGAHVGGRDTAHLLGPLRPPLRGDPPRLREPARAVLDVGRVDVPVDHGGVQHAQREHQVGARHRLQVQAAGRERALGRQRAARIDHDERGPREVAHQRRHRLGRVRPGQQHDVGGTEIGDGERHPAIDAERPVAGCGGRRHAETPVVVDLRGAERDARELAEQVRLLVGEPACAEDRDGVGTVFGDDLPQPAGDVAQRGVPRHLLQVGAAPQQRRREPLGMAQQPPGGPALLAHPAAAGREVAGVDGTGPVDPLPALQRAVRAVGGRARVGDGLTVTRGRLRRSPSGNACGAHTVTSSSDRVDRT